MINNNGIDIWEFLKGLTARVVCLEDALLMKNKQISNLEQELNSMKTLILDLNNKLINPSIKKAPTNFIQKAKEQRAKSSFKQKSEPINTTPLKTNRGNLLNNSNSSIRSSKEKLLPKSQNKSTSKTNDKLQKIQNLTANKPKPVYINISKLQGQGQGYTNGKQTIPEDQCEQPSFLNVSASEEQLLRPKEQQKINSEDQITQNDDDDEII